MTNYSLSNALKICTLQMSWLGPRYSRFGLKLPLDVSHDVLQRIEVFWSNLSIFYRDRKAVLEKGYQLNGTRRIYDVSHQGTVIAQIFGTAKKKRVSDKAPNFAIDLRCVY